ncbi:MAG: FAD-dependent oxidoreductase [Candidatus Bathyarchaeota archaeon]|nr:FAD-dependent oxidoreductase [Candidatus Bathyarchaeota archaeon]
MSKTLDKKYPPCRKACPAGINVQAYIALIAQGKLKEALEIIRKSIPFPSVCGRVCFSPCEDACTRKDIDEPLRIRALKRLVADYEFTSEIREKPKPVPKSHSEKIAIIGSGPAGLTAAYELARIGYPVTVFESASKPGGSLRFCIPEYRLPEMVVDAEIDYIRETGVEIRIDTTIGKDITIDEIKRQGYNAIFIATGAHHCVSINLEGEELDGVFHALDFLKEVHIGNRVELGSRIAIIGGGNVAIDAARTVKRLGPNEVTIIYRRSEKEMPAHHKEVEEAKLEGVNLHFLAAPKRILGKDGKVIGIECTKTALGLPDESGRRRPVPVKGSEFVVPVDSVLLAIGEMPDISFLPKEIEVVRGNRVIVDEVTLETKLPGVFAGGDTVTGPASVIEAIAAGKKAAVSIDRYIKGADLKAGRTKEIPEMTWVSDQSVLKKKPRQTMHCLAPEERVSCFKEVELGLIPDAGLLEAHRCLFCGPCSECLEMEELCEADDALVDEDRCIACANCEKVCEYGAIKLEKSVAKVNLILCKGCGTCVVECPAEAITMQNFSDEKISAQIKDAATSWATRKGPQTLAFVCNWSYNANGFEWSQDTHVVPVKCSGRVDPLHVLHAFMLGADGVLIISCDSKDCHYVFGSFTAEKRVKQMKEWLQAVGIESKRLQVERCSVGNEQHLSEVLKSFAAKLEGIGSTPLK